MIRNALPWIHVGLAVALVLAASLGAPRIAAAESEAGTYLLHQYTMRDYQAHNQLWCAAQDERGVLYFGNRDVILEFDGESWRQIDVPRGLFVRGLAIDGAGTICVGAVDELGYLAPDPAGRLQYVSLLNQLPPEERNFGDIWDVYARTDGIFFTTTNTIFRWRDGGFTTWHRSSLRTNYLIPVGGALHLFERTVGLSRLDGDTWALVSDDGFFRTAAVSIALDEPDRSWLLITADRGIFRHREGRVEPVSTPIDDLLKHADVYAATRLRDGSIALGTLLRGLVILHPDFTVETIIDAQAGLQSNAVKHILEDRDGGLWLSLANGIAHVDRGALTIFDSRRGLPMETMHAIVRHDGRLYVAANLGLYELVPGPPTEGGARLQRIAEISGRVMSLASHPSGLIIANRNQAIRLDDQGRCVPVGAEYPGVQQLYRSAVDPDRVFEGFTRGLAAIRWQDGQWIDEGAVPGIEDDVREMAQTREGVLWAGTPSRGILRIALGPDGRTPIADARVTRFPGGQGLPDDPGWTSAHMANDGSLYFRTNAGLFTFDEQAQQFVRFPHYGRRFSDGTILVSRLVAETNGNLWAAVYPLGEETFPSPWGRGFFGRATPNARGDFDWSVMLPRLFSPIANLSALLVEETNASRVLWVGAESGLVRIELDRLAPPPSPPPVLIREVTVTGGRTVFGGAAGLDSASPSINHTDNGVRFSYAAPYHGTARSVLYQTQLEGFETAWTQPGKEVHREFTNLFEGRYRFLVRATDAQGHPGPESAFAIRVTPPPWRTAGAYAGYALLAGLGVFGLVRWRVAALRRRNAQLELIVTERTAELRIARDEADRANRAKSTFLANMSHELRTPLNGILGYTQILQRSPTIQPVDRQRIEVLQGSGEHLLRLINEVLDLSKIEAGKLELHPVSSDARALVQAVADSFRPRLEDKGLRFVVALDPALPACLLLDEQKIEQVLFNLVGNALKFTSAGSVELRLTVCNSTPEHHPPRSRVVPPPSGGTFSARAAHLSNPSFEEGGPCSSTVGGVRIRFEVLDTGSGIPMDQVATIFEPFRQAAEASGGTGLGLTICARIVALMGGEIRVESTVGVGSRFWFDVPLSVAETEARTASTMPTIIGYAGPRRRVLVVDDVAVNRNVVRELLEPLGFSIDLAPDGAGALVAVTEARPDLVLMDLRMAPMSGAEVIQRLRTEPANRELKIVSFSASALNFTRDDAARLGCDDHLSKPFREAELLAVLERQLGITWERSQPPWSPAADGLVTSAATSSAIAPDARHVHALLELARTGDAPGLRQRIDDLRTSEPALAPLLDDLERLAATFRFQEIRRRLESLLH